MAVLDADTLSARVIGMWSGSILPHQMLDMVATRPSMKRLALQAAGHTAATIKLLASQRVLACTSQQQAGIEQMKPE